MTVCTYIENVREAVGRCTQARNRATRGRQNGRSGVVGHVIVAVVSAAAAMRIVHMLICVNKIEMWIVMRVDERAQPGAGTNQGRTVRHESGEVLIVQDAARVPVHAIDVVVGSYVEDVQRAIGGRADAGQRTARCRRSRTGRRGQVLVTPGTAEREMIHVLTGIKIEDMGNTIAGRDHSSD